VALPLAQIVEKARVFPAKSRDFSTKEGKALMSATITFLQPRSDNHEERNTDRQDHD
jgi:hypothetical protein